MSNPGKTSVTQSALLTIAMRWASRLVGIVSTLILARLLVPADFGVTALAAMVLSLAATFLDIGVNVALIRNTEATLAHYSSAWTLRMIQASVVTLVLFAVAPYAADYFRDPRITPVLEVMALNVVLASFENIGVIEFQKKMQFGLEFRYLLTNRLAGLVFNVAAAFILRNYWALVLGATAGAIFNVANSYRVSPMRPRLAVSKMREIFSLSQWMLVQNIGSYLDNTLHKLLVGRRDSATAMGAYNVADGVAQMPSSELMQPLNRVLFPAFVAAKSNLGELKRIYLLAQGLQVLVALPAAVFMSVLASDLVPVLLGAKWAVAIPLLRTLALGSALLAIRSSAWYVSITLGRERWSAMTNWIQVLAFIVLAFVVEPNAGANEIATFRVMVPGIGLVLQLLICSRALGNLTGSDLFEFLWRPALGIGAAILALHALPMGVGDFPLLLLLWKSAICVVSYVCTVTAAWRLSGAHDGPERYLLGHLAALGRWTRSLRIPTP